MKNLLLTLSCVSVLAVNAHAQDAAKAAAEAAAAARAGAAAARTVGTGARAATTLGTSGAAAGAAARSNGASSMLSNRSSVTAPTCTSTVIGRTDIRNAQNLGVAKQGSACANTLESLEAQDSAGSVLNAAAADLKGENARAASIAKRGHALHESAEDLEKRNGLSDEEAEANIAQVVKKCDIFTPEMSSDAVVNAMKSID